MTMSLRTIGMAGLILLGAATAASSQGRSPFDGAWSVLVITDSGNCDAAYRYAVNVRSGVLRYAGDAAIQLNGQVSESGQVRVTIGRGEQSASGSGRLSSSGGSGTWQGKSTKSQCRGHWQAERRG
jgi:hypothetical protein